MFYILYPLCKRSQLGERIIIGLGLAVNQYTNIYVYITTTLTIPKKPFCILNNSKTLPIYETSFRETLKSVTILHTTLWVSRFALYMLYIVSAELIRLAMSKCQSLADWEGKVWWWGAQLKLQAPTLLCRAQFCLGKCSLLQGECSIVHTSSASLSCVPLLLPRGPRGSTCIWVK